MMTSSARSGARNPLIQIVSGLVQGGILLIVLWGFVLLLALVLRQRDPITFAAARADLIWQSLMGTMTEVFTYGDAGKQLSCTLYVAAKGILIGAVASAIVGVALGFFPEVVARSVQAISALRAIPLTLLIPFLAVLPTWLPIPPWLTEYYARGAPQKDCAYLIALGAFLYLLIGIAEGVRHRNVERESIFRRVVGFNRFRYLFLILVPESMPHVLTSARLATLLGLVLAIVFEQMLQYPGIGRLIQYKMTLVSPRNTLIADVLALLFVVSVVGVLIDVAFVATRKRIVELVGG